MRSSRILILSLWIICGPLLPAQMVDSTLYDTTLYDSTVIESGPFDTMDSGSMALESISLYYDSSAIEPRLPSASAIEALRNDEELQYHVDVRTPETIWQRIMAWLGDLLGGAISANEWFLYTVAGLVIALTLWKIIASGFSAPFTDSGEIPGGVTGIDENIHEIDFDSRIDAAVRAGDYRLAVRLLYLKGLRRLSERGLIDWRRDKTNHDYLRELEGTGLTDAFARGTILFEYVCYGDFPIDQQSYAPIADRLRSFIERVEGKR